MGKKGSLNRVNVFYLTLCLMLGIFMATGGLTVYAEEDWEPFYKLTCTPAEINFGEILEGDYVEPQLFIIENTGNLDVFLVYQPHDGNENFILDYEFGIVDNLDDFCGNADAAPFHKTYLSPGDAITFEVAPVEDLVPGEYVTSYEFYNLFDDSVDLNVPVSLTVVPKPVVTVVEVTPGEVTVAVGKECQFEANVDGENLDEEDKTVTWSIEGNTSTGTAIDEDGLLTVGIDEDASYVTVVATSVQDPDIYAEADVEIDYIEHEVYISADPYEGGSVYGGGTVRDGRSVEISASPYEGYVFDGWYEDDELISSSAEYNVPEVTSDIELFAKFEKATFTVTTLVNDPDAGTITPGETVEYGEDFTVTAFLLKSGYKFKGFSENGEILSEDSTYTITNITSDREITAEFVKTYNITTHVNNSDAGTITHGKVVGRGDSFTITATAQDGYIFKRFTENGETLSEDSTYTITNITSDRDITAEFEKLKYNIETHVNDPDAGTITAGKEVDYGAKYTITATAKTGYKFKRFTENGSTISESKQLELTNISSDRDITAEFVKTYIVTATISPSSSGTVENAGTYEAGEQVWLKAIPYEGYEFVGWSNSSQTVSTDLEYLTDALEKDIKITATFKKQEARKHTIASDVANQGGKISPSGNTSVEEGKSITYTMTPNSGYRVHNVAIDGVGIGAVDSYTFSNVYEQHSIAVSFEKIPEKAASQSENLNNRSGGSEDQEDTEDSEDADEALKAELANEAENKSSTPRLIERRNMTEQTKENVHESDAVEQFDEPFIIEEEETAKAASAEAMMDSNSLSATGGNSSIINPLVIRIVVILLLATVFGSIVYTYYWLFNNKDGKA